MGSYFADRGRDACDIVDVKYGLGVGITAKVEATNYLGLGVGFGGYENQEKCGRKLEKSGGIFLHAGVAGMDGAGVCTGPKADGNVLLLNVAQLGDAFHVSAIRFGGEIGLPGGTGGLYFNLGELADFFLGLFGLDVAGDDAPTTEPAVAVPSN